MAAGKNNNPSVSAEKAGGGLFAKIRGIFSGKFKDEAPNTIVAGSPQNPGVGGSQLEKGFITQGAHHATKALGHTHTALNKVNRLAVYGTMAAGALGVAGSLPAIGKYFSKAAEKAERPEQLLRQKTLRDLGHAGSTLLGKTAARLPADKGVTQKLTSAEQAVGAIEGRVLSQAKGVLQAAAAPLATVVENHKGGVLGRVTGSRADKASQEAGLQFDAASSALDDLLATSGERENLGGLSNALNGIKNALGSGAAEVDKGKVKGAVDGVLSKIETLSADGGLGEDDRGILEQIKEGVVGTQAIAETASHKHAVAQAFQNPAEAIRNAPSKLGEVSIKNAALKGAVVTGLALQVTSTAKGIGDKVHTLKQLYCDMTGETKISTRKLMFSKKMPPVIKEARSHIFKEYGPGVVLNFVSTLASYTFLKNNNMKAMMGSFALSGISSMHNARVQGFGILPLYDVLSKKPQIQDVEYAALISAASKDAQAAGGAESPLVQALAVDYAQEGVRPADILREIENGKFDERALRKVEEHKAAQHNAAAAVAAGEGMRPQAFAQQQDAVMPGRDVMGLHTQRLQEAGRRGAPGVVR